MTSAINTSVNPYYDDFDEDKSFHRLLFRPGRAVQARELTQLQTVLQNQIARFGQNIFKEGSVIVPGGISIDTNYEYVKVDEANISTAVVGDTLTGQTSNATAKILQKVSETGSDPSTFYIRYTGVSRFEDGEDLVVSGTGSGTFTTITDCTGRGTKVNLDKGIWFVKGYFAAAVSQSLIIEKYGIPSGEMEIGLVVSESIVNSSQDSSLLDNAAGSTNVNAPGADRLKVTLTLAKKEDYINSDGFADDDYISLATIIDGVIVEKFLKTQYNLLGDELARRTYDESGNYTVDPFIAEITDHPSDTTKLRIKLDPGKAYVRGYEIEKVRTSNIDVSKALTTTTQNNSKTSCSFGNYVRVQSLINLPNISQLQEVDLLDNGSGPIGSARVRVITKESGSIYRVYLFDVVMDSSGVFSDVRWLESGSFSARLINDDNTVLGTGDSAKLYDTSSGILLFKIPQNRVKECTDITVRCQKRITGTTNGSGSVTLDTGDSSVTWEDTSSWIVVNTSTGAIVSPTYGSTGAQTITVSGLANSTGHTFFAIVDKTTATTRARTKTLTTVTNETRTPGVDGSVTLTKMDIYTLVSVLDASASDANITSKYVLDNGQRPGYYDRGRLLLKSGETAPAGNVKVNYTYFEHGSGDYYSVDSYDGIVGTSGYSAIPSYIAPDGTEYRLSDYFDFRSKKDNNGADFSSTGALVNELPKINETIQADVEYYLPRIDVLYLDSNGSFGTSTGIASLNPRVPNIPLTAMPIYTLFLEAGTLDKEDCSIIFRENKRYTMRDIGKIEQRIDRLEEWTTLSLLEVETNSLEVLDNNGLNRFKSGFFVDNFRSHNFSDTNSIEYRASIDPISGECRSPFVENYARLIYRATASDSTTSSNVIVKGDSLLLNYTEVAEIIQPWATEAINVNPYDVVVNTGSIQLSPETDEWRDVVTTAVSVTVNDNAPIVPVQDLNFNSWQFNWTGINEVAGL